MIPEEYREYEKTVTVACINWHSIWGDKAANLEKVKEKVTEAAKIGANIIAFPELALSGYECGEEARRDNKPCAMHREAAETIPGPSTEEVAKLSKELGVYVILGMPERDNVDSNVLYISSAVIGPEGILGKYRKIHLAPFPWMTERVCFKPGNELPVFETIYGPIGVQICSDFWHMPECSRILYLQGARIIFNTCGSGVGPSKVDFITHQTACRATENFIYTASCNHVGKERTLSYYGHSTIAGPSFPLLTKIFAQGGDSEEIVSATLNFESLHFLQSRVDVKKLGNWELIAKEYKRIGKICRPVR